MADLVSVIIPVFNHARVLSAAIDSILKQSYRPLEVIVVNDGSTDNFDFVIKRIISDEHNRELNIQVINQDNRGASSARNRGFLASKGRMVIFWDADTVAEEEMLKKMHLALQKNPLSAYAYSGFKFGIKKFKSQSFDEKSLKQNNFIDTTSLIRREFFSGFDESLKRFQDWDLWLTLLEKNKTGIFVPEILYKKFVGNRTGMSLWLPSFVYKLPVKWQAIKDYETKKSIVLEKHRLLKRR